MASGSRYIDTPHVPHGWEAGLIFEETTSTLFSGDLFTATGVMPAITDADIVEPAIAGEEMFHATALTPTTAPTIRRLADLDPATLALMHGPRSPATAAKRSSRLPRTTSRWSTRRWKPRWPDPAGSDRASTGAGARQPLEMGAGTPIGFG